MDKVFHIRTFNSPNGACQEVELDLPATDYELLDAMEQLRLEDGKHPYLEFHAVEEYDYLNERIQETDIFPLNALAKRLAELDTRGMAVFEGLVCMDIQKGVETIPICLHGLIGHGACLAAHGSGEQLPALRDFICGLAAFWPDPFEEDDDPVVREEHYGALFDDAVSAAQNGVDVPELSEGRKENIIIGLENYIIDLAGQFSEINQEALDSGLGACESIAAGFQEMWTDPVHTRRVETIQTPSQVLT